MRVALIVDIHKVVILSRCPWHTLLSRTLAAGRFHLILYRLVERLVVMYVSIVKGGGPQSGSPHE